MTFRTNRNTTAFTMFFYTSWKTFIYVTACVALFIVTQASAAANVGDLITLELDNGEQLGPFILKDINTHGNEFSATNVEGSRQVEGSGDQIMVNDDTVDEDYPNNVGDESPIVNTADTDYTYDYYDYPDDDITLEESPSERVEVDAETMPETSRLSNIQLFNNPMIQTPTNEQLPPTHLPTTGNTKTEPNSSSQHTTKPTIEVTTQTIPKVPTFAPTIPPTQLSYTQSTPTASPCHQICKESLRQSFVMRTTPNVAMVRQGGEIMFTCTVAIWNNVEEGVAGEHMEEDIQLHWLFEGEQPPQRECSLSPQPFLQPCNGFLSINSTELRNTTHLRTMLKLHNLQQNVNTGKYICQAVAHCCSNESVQQQQRSHHVTVWEASYTTELLLLSGTALILALILAAALVYQYRGAKESNQMYTKVTGEQPLYGTVKTRKQSVVHIPVDDQDTESFSDEDNPTPPRTY